MGPALADSSTPEKTPPIEATVYLVDPDPRARSRLSALLGRFTDVVVRGFASAEELLDGDPLEPPGCVICEMDLPGMDGLELQRRLLERPGPPVPVLFVVGQGEIRSAVEAVRRGAIDFLVKPCHAAAFQRAVADALRTATAGSSVGPKTSGRTR